MNRLYRYVCVFTLIALSITACSAPSVQAKTKEPVLYETLLGRSLTDAVVVDFLTGNNCSSVNQFELCKEAGMALWLDSSQVVTVVYLYLNNAEGFQAYKGELPFGLRYYDSLGAVEYKLNRQGVGNKGLPDEGSSPDHHHYWAEYKQYGVTIIYNSPFADEDATIYAILVSK